MAKYSCTTLVLCFGTVMWAGRSTTAIDQPTEVLSLADCGEFLKVSVEAAGDGLLRYRIRINPEQRAQAGELYKGAVTARAHLQIASADSPMASLFLEPIRDAGETYFEFQISAAVRERSVVAVSTHLHEKDGKPTLGGGSIDQVHLKGFPPVRAPR